MRALALLLLAAAAWADVKAPLGPWARLGVPVLLTSDAPVVVDIDGWTWRVDGPTLVHPPRLPAVVRDRATGEELLRLEPVPDGMWLVGYAGDAPAGLDALHADVKVVAFDPEAVPLDAPRVLDLFDRILLADPTAGAIVPWHEAGGTVAARFEGEPARALGPWLRAERIEDALVPPMPPRFPRTGNVRPDLYDLVWPAEGSPAPLRSALWIAAGAGAAMALQVLLAAAGRMRVRTLACGLGAVAAIGSLLGVLRPAADYRPVAEGRIEVVVRDGDQSRVRTYRVFAWAGPGASFDAPAGATPVLYRDESPPWWSGPGGRCELEEGVVRIFLEEDGRGGPGAAAGDETADRALARTAARERPDGTWTVRLERPAQAPAPPPQGPVLLARITFVAQD